MLAELAIGALRAVAGVVYYAVIGGECDRIVLCAPHHRVNTVAIGLDGFDVPVLVVVVAFSVGLVPCQPAAWAAESTSTAAPSSAQ